MRPASIPVAIVVGMTIIGALLSGAVYFGLRARAGTAPSAGPNGDRVSSAPIAETVPPPAVPTAAPLAAVTTPVDRATAVAQSAAATAQVTRELDAVHAQLVAQCWRPSFAKRPLPDHAKLVVDVTFDANGKETARGLTEDRATARSDVTFCVQTSVPALHIDPTGAAVHLNVPLSLP